MVVYITTQGSRIIREGRHLLVRKGTDTYRTLFVHKLKQVLLFGNVELTSSARNMLLHHGVDTVFFTRDGRFRGRFAVEESKNVLLRKRQFLSLDNEEFGLKFCRQIVYGKLANMATLLMRISRTKKNGESAARAQEIRRLFHKLDTAQSINSLRGYEGRGSALYFSVLKLGFVRPMGFTCRVRRPPTDPVNAVLSLLYTFLFNRVYAAVRITNLDPYPSFLHTPDYGRFSLVLDLMEEFRIIIVDTLTLSLFNLNILNNDDFRIEQQEALCENKTDVEKTPDVTKDYYGITHDTGDISTFDTPAQRMADRLDDNAEQKGGKPPVLLKVDAFKRVLEQFERKLTTEFFYLPEQRKITYADALVSQAGQYRKLIEGSLDVYQPVLLK